MMGRQVAQGSLFYGFRLDDPVPADHLLRRIDGLLDFGFVRKALAASYSASGRPSVDPELMLRMLPVGYLLGIRSERRLCEEVHLNLAYRWFCRLDLGNRVPDHSTFSKNRHGRFRQCDLYRLLFEEVVARCAAVGLVAGREVAVDGSTIMADASWEKKLPGATAADSLRAREAVTRPVAEYLAALDAALPPELEQPAPVERAHVSPTDPQAALTCKHGPARFAYAINPLLDLHTDCILDVEATPARFSAEVAATRTLLSRVRTKLGITPASLAADKAYGNGPLLGWLVGQNITPYVPVIDRTRQRDGFFTRDAFTYDAEADAYRCPADKPLGYMGTVQASQVRRYRSRAADCAACPLKPQCTIARQRTITRLVDEDARDQVRALVGTEGYARARQRRKRIERVFGHLKRNLKLRSLKLRGLAGAAEEFTMAAAAYNLQLLAKRVAPA
jgi:transposase